jgi:hypothetical protein
MSVYWYNAATLKHAATTESFPGLVAWRELNKAFMDILVDRTGTVQSPIKTLVDPGLAIPDPCTYPTKTFEECCFERTDELLRTAEAQSKQIHLMFSGGIDSTTIAVAFLKYHPHARLRDRIKILTSSEAWVENASFVREHLIGKFDFLSMRSLQHSCSGQAIIVSGEMNDYYIPNSQYKRLGQMGDVPYTEYSRDRLAKHLSDAGMNPGPVGIWVEILDRDQQKAPVEIDSFETFLWWVRFNWARQTYKFLPLMSIDTIAAGIHCLNDFDSRFQHFFDSTAFQVWGMGNTDRSPRKNHCRDLIRSYSSDKEWIEQKQKYNSFEGTFALQKLPLGFDTTFRPFYLHEELLGHFDQNNHFYARTKR